MPFVLRWRRGVRRRRPHAVGGVLEIDGQVDDDGAGTPGAGEGVGVLDDGLDVADARDGDNALGGGAEDGRDVDVLERVGPELALGHLAGDDEQRHAVGERVGHGGEGVGDGLTGGDDSDAHLIASARIAGGGERRALLVGSDRDLNGTRPSSSITGRMAAPE